MKKRNVGKRKKKKARRTIERKIPSEKKQKGLKTKMEEGRTPSFGIVQGKGKTKKEKIKRRTRKKDEEEG